MGDDHPPEAVERRCAELSAFFEDQESGSGQAKQESPIERLNRWRAEQKAMIEGLPIDDALREEQLISLETRFAELLAEHMERSRP
jgi:hypothetical protein